MLWRQRLACVVPRVDPRIFSHKTPTRPILSRLARNLSMARHWLVSGLARGQHGTLCLPCALVRWQLRVSHSALCVTGLARLALPSRPRTESQCGAAGSICHSVVRRACGHPSGDALPLHCQALARHCQALATAYVNEIIYQSPAGKTKQGVRDSRKVNTLG